MGVNLSLRCFRDYLDIEEAGQRRRVESCAHVDNAMGQGFKTYLLEARGLATITAARRMADVRGIVSDALRRLDPSSADLAWPTVRGTARPPHVDVDPEVVRGVAKLLLQRHEAWGRALAEGAGCLSTGTDPRTVGDGTEIGAWSAPENVAVVAHAFVEAAVADPCVKLQGYDVRLRYPDRHGLPRLRPSPPIPIKPAAFNVVRWFAPVYRDITGSFLLLVLITGWNPETALNVVFEGDWAKPVGSDASGRRFVEIRGRKLRTGKSQTLVVAMDGPLSAYRIIHDVRDRTEALRLAAKRRLAHLRKAAAEGDTTHGKELSELTDACGSLWIYLMNGSRPRAVSNVRRLLHSVSVNDLLEEAVRHVGGPASNRPDPPARKGPGSRRPCLVPSDLRDAMADYVLSGTDGSIAAVQDTLCHADASTSHSYARQARMVRQCKEAFATFFGMVLEEARTHGLDPAVLYLRARGIEPTPEQRARLARPGSSPHAEENAEIQDDPDAHDDGESGRSAARRTLRGDDAAAAWPDYESWDRAAEGDHSPVRDGYHDDPAPSDVWSMPWEALCRVEPFPGCRVEDDAWIVPIDLVSDCHKALGDRLVDFKWLLPFGWRRGEARSETAIRRLKRMALLLRDQPVIKDGKVLNPPALGSWVTACEYLLHAGRIALHIAPAALAWNWTPTTRCPDGPSIFSLLGPEQMREVSSASPGFARFVVHRLNSFLASGTCDDWPATDVASQSADKGNKHPPFGDDFTSATLTAALWLVEKAGPDILACYRDCLKLRAWLSPDDKNDRAIEAEAIATWEGKFLKPGTELDIALRLRSGRSMETGTVIMDAWPPRNFMALRSMVTRLEEAHLALLALSTCARRCEIEGLPYNCLSKHGRWTILNGTVSKTSDKVGGDPGYWVLPEAVALAARQQQELVDLVAPRSGRLFPSWRCKNGTGGVLTKDKYLKRFAERVHTGDGRTVASRCEGNIHYGRCRPTGVRLAALALPNAVVVLMNLLGHAWRDSTLGYVKANPEAALEMRTVAERAWSAVRIGEA